MPTLVFATAAVEAPGGAQGYEEAVAARAAAALAATGGDWEVRRLVARSIRSRLSGTHRLPLGRITRADSGIRSRAGRLLYPRGALVHRTSLELPPAPLEVVTLHDLVAWDWPDESPPVRAAVTELRRAAAVVCVSAHTAGLAVDRFGLRDPVVVPNGLDRAFLDATPLGAQDLARWGLRAPFVLHLGGVSARKNLAALAEGWGLLAPDHPDVSLALAGTPHPRRHELFAGMPRTHLLGRVPDPDLPGLVAAASVVVVPSLDEGFGLPALEAMATGTLVVAARAGALPEVVGRDGILVDPTGPGVAEGLGWALSGDSSLARLTAAARTRAAGYTWERTAAGHAAVWAAVAGG